MTQARDASIAVVIVNYRTPDLTERCLGALKPERALLPKLRAIVVDGGSGDGSAARLVDVATSADYADWVSFLPLPINGGFGWANNQAIQTLAGEAQPPQFIHLLNPDAEVLPGAVAALVEEMIDHPRCGAAGSQLLDEAGRQVGSAFRFPSPGRELIGAAQSEALGRLLGITPLVVRSPTSIEVDWVTGASVMLRGEALRTTGLFDDGFFLYFEEVELMHRMKARGWMVRHVPASRVAHLEGASTGIGSSAEPRPLPDFWYRSRRRYFALTGGSGTALAADCCWLAGDLMTSLKSLMGRSATGQRPRARDMVRLGLWPRHGDQVPSVPAWGEAPGKPPSWMAGA